MTDALPTLPAPAISAEVAHYWAAAGEGKLAVRTCNACGELHHYPRAICPFCHSDQLDWREAAGTGTIYSFSVMRRAPVPYAIAYVTLDEGVTMLSHIVGTDFDAIRIGQRVTVDFAPTEGDGPKVPVFRVVD
ncbi:Zn-ribbon domain-containing OB-fold protein [Sphingomonas sp. CJ99]